jgi:transcriptional regulator with XRE-family HTH domain
MDSTESVTVGKRRLVTMNQIVAWNMAWYRREAGMTQQQVGDHLGWTARAVSEAERSWDSGRTREFDAQLLADLAAIFEVPVIAFFLPPDETDGELRYPSPGSAGELDMTDLMWIVMHDNDSEGPAMEAFRTRILTAARARLTPEWAEEVARWLKKVTPDSFIEDQAAIWESEEASLERSRDRAGQMARALRAVLKGELK